jgi:hypothetical protein
MTSPQVGSSFDDFLKEEGIRDAAYAQAIKRVLAWQVAEAMKVQGLAKSEMVKRMNLEPRPTRSPAGPGKRQGAARNAG